MRSWSINLFPVFGIRLEVHLTFFLLLAYFGYVGWEVGELSGMFWSMLFLLLAFTCVILHELGHSLTAQHYGIPVLRILLLPIGGMAQFQSLPKQPRTELVITLAGPAVNFVLAAMLFPLAGNMQELFSIRFIHDTTTLVQGLFLMNLVMGTFNLLPIFPMDGGRILRALLAFRLPYLSATRISVGLAKALSLAGAVFALFFMETILLAILFGFIFIFGDLEYRMVRRREMLEDLYVGDLVRRNFLTLNPDHTLADALRFLAHHNPQDFVVMKDSKACGVLSKKRVRWAAENNRLSDRVGQHYQPNVSILQAEWPLAPFYESVTRRNQMTFPVYSLGQLIGTLNRAKLDESIQWHLLRKKAEEMEERKIEMKRNLSAGQT